MNAKFKAKKLGSDSWVFGIPCYSPNSPVINFYDCMQYIVDGEIITEYIYSDTLCMYSGVNLPDSTELYDGDLLEYKGCKYKISYECGKFILRHISILKGTVWGDLSKLFDCGLSDFLNGIKKVGNIYE